MGQQLLEEPFLSDIPGPLETLVPCSEAYDSNPMVQGQLSLLVLLAVALMEEGADGPVWISPQTPMF